MTRRMPRSIALLFVHVLSVGSVAQAQTGLSRAVQELPRTPVGDVLTAIRTGRLYGGVIDATITEQDRNRDTFGASDCIDFTIRPRVGDLAPLQFRGPRSAAGAGLCPGTQGTFDEWARRESTALLAIIFPSSLGGEVLGRTPSELYSQQFLLTTALGTDEVRRQGQGGRALAGGLFEFESLRRADRQDGDSAWAWQGLYGINRTMSVQGRFAQQRESFTTHATTVSFDYHPFIEIQRGITWRVGGSARGGFLYSRSNAMDLGSLEFGGGGWVSGYKALGRVRVGGGTILQGAKSYVPGALTGDDADLGFLADAINDRGIQYDLAFGGTAGVDTSDRTRVIVKILENSPLSTREVRADSWSLLTGLSYRVGLPTLNFGYKYFSTTALSGHSLFFQGNFDW
jgi:hypothetical protein